MSTLQIQLESVLLNDHVERALDLEAVGMAMKRASEHCALVGLPHEMVASVLFDRLNTAMFEAAKSVAERATVRAKKLAEEAESMRRSPSTEQPSATVPAGEQPDWRTEAQSLRDALAKLATLGGWMLLCKGGGNCGHDDTVNCVIQCALARFDSLLTTQAKGGEKV